MNWAGKKKQIKRNIKWHYLRNELRIILLIPKAVGIMPISGLREMKISRIMDWKLQWPSNRMNMSHGIQELPSRIPRQRSIQTNRATRIIGIERMADSYWTQACPTRRINGQQLWMPIIWQIGYFRRRRPIPLMKSPTCWLRYIWSIHRVQIMISVWRWIIFWIVMITSTIHPVITAPLLLTGY